MSHDYAGKASMSELINLIKGRVTALLSAKADLSAVTKYYSVDNISELGLTTACVPADLWSALPNGSLFMAKCSQLSNVVWNFDGVLTEAKKETYTLVLLKCGATVPGVAMLYPRDSSGPKPIPIYFARGFDSGGFVRSNILINWYTASAESTTKFTTGTTTLPKWDGSSSVTITLGYTPNFVIVVGGYNYESGVRQSYTLVSGYGNPADYATYRNNDVDCVTNGFRIYNWHNLTVDTVRYLAIKF